MGSGVGVRVRVRVRVGVGARVRARARARGRVGSDLSPRCVEFVLHARLAPQVPCGELGEGDDAVLVDG